MTEATAAADYAALLRVVASVMRAEGFRGSRGRFVCENTETWGLVQFQKSRRSTRDRALFTVNLGVASKAILDLDEKSQPPSVDECHWNIRLGQLVSGQDEWYVAGEPGVEQAVVGQLRSAAVPAIREYMSNAALARLWSSGLGQGTTNFQRLEYLSAILAVTGQVEAAQEVIRELLATSEGRVTERAARAHARLVSRALSG